MEDKVNSILKTSLKIYDYVSTNVFVRDARYKVISTILLPSANFSEDYVEEYADSLYFEIFKDLLVESDVRIDCYESSVYKRDETIYLDITFKYDVPIKDRVKRKSMLMLLSQN